MSRMIDFFSHSHFLLHLTFVSNLTLYDFVSKVIEIQPKRFDNNYTNSDEPLIFTVLAIIFFLSILPLPICKLCKNSKSEK